MNFWVQLPVASLHAFLISSTLILVPSVYAITRRKGSNLNTGLQIFTLLHSVYILYVLLLEQPPNLFNTLDLPLTAPTEQIRAGVLRHAYGFGVDESAMARFGDEPTLPDPMEELLKKLRSFEARTLYIRYGQYVVQTCSYCSNQWDYALYALPIPLIQYMRTLGIIGFLTVQGTRKQRWRTIALGALVAAAIAEAYGTSTHVIKLNVKPGETILMWHDYVWLARHILFLVLPLLVLFLPSQPPSTINEQLAAMLPQTVQTLAGLESVMKRVHLVKYTHGAIMRTPLLRERSAKWWAEERAQGRVVREDPDVQRVAQKMGVGFQEGHDVSVSHQGPQEGEKDVQRTEAGKLRASARDSVGRLTGAYAPNPMWTTPAG